MAKFVKKPVVIEAIQWAGDNLADVRGFSHNIFGPYGQENAHLEIETLEGRMTVLPFDWIIKGVKGEVYPCKPDIFDLTYAPVPE